MAESDRRADEPIAIAWTWTVMPGKEEQFERIMHEIHKAARTFPGHMGVTTLQSPERSDRFQTVLRFDTAAHLEAWLHSDIRHELVKPLVEVTHADTTAEATGLETWFEVPGQRMTPPSRWKMAATTFIAIYPLSLLYGFFVAPNTTSWSTPARALILPIVAPLVLTYLFMPFLTQKVLRRWLYENPA